jgi:hypothetical protein
MSQHDESEAAEDGQRNAPLNLRVTLFSSKTCWSLVSGYGILRDCAVCVGAEHRFEPNSKLDDSQRAGGRVDHADTRSQSNAW